MPQIQVWINNDKPENVAKIVKTLDDAMQANKDKKLKAFMIFVTNDDKKAESELPAMADKEKANDIMLAYLGKEHEAVGYYKVNLDPEVKNTVMLYRKKTITAKQVNLVADEKGLAELKKNIDDLLQ